ncbi:ubiquinol-cytochrome c reductase iron-sulfur subunit [Christiangramia sabulilitoris]|uniref:Rieske (2Fe-2S) protein n=1 Tax=Christiangramia sabulilitoris TaxID=2583991 RepID=A0A550I040_9FLAO|nr:Rieske (2Fe-2S) protein [Christiangramia sabulilitoris]TRO64341.1 Rieske (2Fe-2S) protein [Christiangramia sabulilitoris]
MKRGEFIVKGVLLACSGACVMSACSSGDDSSPAPNPPGNGGPATVAVSLSNLVEVGDQISSNGVLFFRIGEGNTSADFVATESVCPHQGGQLVWQEDQGYIECQLHFARYEDDGDVIRGPQGVSGNTRDLRVYSTSISGNTITATIG